MSWSGPKIGISHAWFPLNFLFPTPLRPPLLSNLSGVGSSMGDPTNRKARKKKTTKKLLALLSRMLHFISKGVGSSMGDPTNPRAEKKEMMSKHARCTFRRHLEAPKSWLSRQVSTSSLQNQLSQIRLGCRRSTMMGKRIAEEREQAFHRTSPKRKCAMKRSKKRKAKEKK